MNENICSPSKQYKSRFTCFSKESLVKIAKAYNNKVGNNKIDIVDDSYKLYKNISKQLSKVCNNEICWARQSYVTKLNDDDINNHTFKPPKPSGSKYQWLSTIDIRNVMKQYEKKFKDFIFLGPFPIDFDDIQTEIAQINLKKLKEQNINKMGIVFNLDKHNQSGSHWVALYFEFSQNKTEVDFFDSYGESPHNRIKILMDRLVKMAKNQLNLNINQNINRVRMQYANSECGVYSMNFILHLLLGESFEKTTQNIVLDEEMNMRRNLFFNSSSQT